MSNLSERFLNSCSDFARSLLSPGCLLCGAAARHGEICRDCLLHLPFIPRPTCIICARPIHGASVCGACLADPPHFEHALAVFSYSFPVDSLIQSLKYRGNLALAPLLGDFLSDAARLARPDFLIPVPLHPERLKSRGFNQAHEIARQVSKSTGIKLVQAKKIKNTPPQTGLPANERKKNIRGAFACDLDFKQMHVAVIDDVMTSGSTQNEMAKMLKRRGAREVSAWVVARA